MNESSSGPRPGARDNGLRCAGYIAVGDLDPRVADALLDSLRAEGIAAYADPTPASRGVGLEHRLPNDLTDRVYVDSEKSRRAMELFEQEKSDASHESAPAHPSSPDSLDVDAAWKQLLTSLQTPSETASWPERENVSAGSPPATFDEKTLSVGAAPYQNLEDEHFVPPPPPPLPRLRSVTSGALLTILGGIAILVTRIDGGDLGWLGVGAIIGGAIALIWNMRQEPPTDSGWDDGAVV